MANGIIGAVSVFAVTAFLFLVQNLFFTLGKSKKKLDRAVRFKAAKKGSRQNESHDEMESGIVPKDDAISHTSMEALPRFRV